MVISGCYFSDDGTELFLSASRTCSTLIFPQSTNEILNLWRCNCCSRRQRLSPSIIAIILFRHHRHAVGKSKSSYHDCKMRASKRVSGKVTAILAASFKVSFSVVDRLFLLNFSNLRA